MGINTSCKELRGVKNRSAVKNRDEIGNYFIGLYCAGSNFTGLKLEACKELGCGCEKLETTGLKLDKQKASKYDGCKEMG